MNKITCYQRLVQAIVNNAKYGEDFEYEFESFPGFARRGHSEREFRDWVKCIKWVLDVLQTHDGSLNAKKEFCRQSVSSAGLYAVPRYRLREEELQIIASAERFGRGDGGEILKYGNKTSFPTITVTFRDGKAGARTFWSFFPALPKAR